MIIGEDTVMEKQEGSTKKEKICFVIMTITDEPHPHGHFKTVYKYLIRPACEKAGFKPLRSDDIKKTNHIVIEVLHQLLNADMAICDLSAKNPNVLYELGIRQAFDLPVTLIKDDQTERIFDIQGTRDVEYDAALRVDMVEQGVKDISEALLNTYQLSGDKGEVNSLIKLLSIPPAKIEEKAVSDDTRYIVDLLKDVDGRLNSIEDQINRLGASLYVSMSPSMSKGRRSPTQEELIKGKADQNNDK